MEMWWFAAVVLLVMSAAVGFVVYEMLVRTHRPSASNNMPNVGVMLHNQSCCGRERDSVKNMSNKPLSWFVRLSENYLPMNPEEEGHYSTCLSRAGWKIGVGTWHGVRVSALLAGLSLALVAISSLGANPALSLVLLLACVVSGWYIPRAFLQQAVTRRRLELESQLPDAMELLGIAIAAGSPVEQCFREVAQNIENPLASEFEWVDKEVNLLGHSREKALANMSQRCASSEVAAFTSQLAQAISQGSSLVEGLSLQAEIGRASAHAKVLERIKKMPTKLDIILSFCFLPPTVVLVIAPTVVNLLDFLNDTLK